jgi:serine/threonine-protein kinase
MSDSTLIPPVEEPLRPPGNGSGSGPGAAVGGDKVIVRDDQPTVITHRTPVESEPVSEAAVRILQGRILPGDHLGHFELVEYVGGGGMGRVFRAVDPRLARTVALKVLPPEQSADRETLLRFQNEAQSAARLDHDNIARVYYVGEDRGLHYIVMEFIEGVNVRRLVDSRGPLALAEAVSYTLQVADALAHAASRSVVHRDIKPSNLLITPEGQAKLIDMGLARFHETDEGALDLTASGVTLGTFDYISPEQARDPRNADVRSDIYSLGCTFFYMLTGRPPFLGGTMLQKLLQHQADQPPDVRGFRPELPEDVPRILRKMLAKDPRHRYRTPSELVEDLLALVKSAGLRRPAGARAEAATGQSVVPFWYRHLPWVVPLVALLAIVLVLDAVWSDPAGQGPAPPELPAIGAEGPRPEQPAPQDSKRLKSGDGPKAQKSEAAPPSSHQASRGTARADSATPAGAVPPR